MRLIVFLLPLAVAACTQFPELEASVSPQAEAADYPELVPIDPLLARVTTPQETQATEQSVQARADALRRRADRLRGRVVDAATRARMADGVAEG